MISYKPFTSYDGFRYRNDFKRLSNMNMLAHTIMSCCWSPCVWQNNNRLSSEFESAHFLVLDFDDDGPETMAEVNHTLRDHKRIIATTKSHQKPKNGLVCDRYRLIIPFERPIYDYAIYKSTYLQALKRFYWADQACHDGARFFFPCNKIVCVDRESEYSWEIYQGDKPQVYIPPPVTGKIPGWILAFINDGDLGGRSPSRNLRVFQVCAEMFRQGFGEGFIRHAVLRAPIEWKGVSLESIIKSARSKNV